jgi:precorrin-6Y C5,15-methyltransferase (decarboxylating)
MWDVGAGSGSVGIEAVRIAPGLRVYAVERDQARLEMIQKNVQGLGAFGVKAVRGEAPEALTDLPDPDRVFIGGSGGRLIEILNLVEERFREEGRAVVSVATPETLGRAQTYLEKSHLAHEWRLLQVSRTVPIQPTKKRPESNLLSRFQSQTPLFILSLWRS